MLYPFPRPIDSLGTASTPRLLKMILIVVRARSRFSNRCMAKNSAASQCLRLLRVFRVSAVNFGYAFLNGAGDRVSCYWVYVRFWLPNDQLGSGSDTVRAPWLPPFGPATKVNARRSVAHRPFDRQVRQMARASLRYQPVVLSDAQVAAIGRGVTDEIQRFQPATIHAFAHLRAHFHFACGPCRYDIRRFAGRLKGAGTRQRMAEGLHPMAKYADAAGHVPSMWSVKPWLVYLFDDQHMRRSIQYVHNKLLRARMRPQNWSFVKAYGGPEP